MNILDSRILLKRSTVAGTTPTVPASSSHTDGTWVSTDIYEGELFLNTVDSRLFTRQGSNIKEIGLQDSLIGATQYASITLTSAQILAIGTTPITIITAPGANKSIWVKNAFCRINYNTTTYSASDLILRTNGSTAGNYVAIENLIVSSTTTRFSKFLIQEDALSLANDNYILDNAALVVTNTTGSNPTTGNSTIDILVEYQVLDFNAIF